MSDDGSYGDYAGDGDEDGGDYNGEDARTTGYVEEVPIDVETTGYAEVEESNDDNYRDAEGDNGGDDDEHPIDNGSSNPNHEDEDRDDEDDHDEHDGSMSNYEYMKPWGGTHGFMRCYGIKRSPEGYEEARDSVDTMREMAEKHGNLE